ncbi:hypothetical protein DBR11_12960 [Pedobacter sp. HMWF019]|uniref:hypothetical protein n=1 Tax=Pedobacter sp. HMWF019 TaxID=2056856 RepID=UPI000D3B3AE1|nr:hypothetical protein [Pedobacter sp. HMWF019]PTS99193.1 hypothetical protein DBR11_12960 [Pedobacter sp. HMWF019]
MHHTQDNEFDQLFKDRFDQAELEPSLGLWDKIEPQLQPAVKKRFPVYWMAAAAVAVALTAGLLFINKPEKIRLQGQQENMARVEDKPVPAVINNNRPNQLVIQGVEIRSVVSGASKNEVSKPAVVPALAKKDLIAMQPIPSDDHLKVIVEHVKPVVQQSADALQQEGQKTLAAAGTEMNEPDKVINENEQSERKGIRNFGDLVNYVVDKVDKREQKIVRFKTDDDDESSLVAINIGFIKFNPKKHK